MMGFPLPFARRRQTNASATSSSSPLHLKEQDLLEDAATADDDDAAACSPGQTRRDINRASLASTATMMTMDGNSSSRRLGSSSSSNSRASATLLLFGHFLRNSRTSGTVMFEDASRLQNRLSKSRSSSKLTSADVAASPDMIRVNQVIATKRRLLVRELMGVAGDNTVKISFIDAVDQFLGEEDLAKREKMGTTICHLFIQGDMFKISSFSPDLAKRLEQGQLSLLEEAKLELLTQLSLDPVVMNAVSVVEALDCL